MTNIPILAAAAFGGAISSLAVWGALRPGVKAAAIAAYAGLLLALGLTHVNALSHPKPVAWERADLKGAAVRAFTLDEGRAIYLWVVLPGSTEPRAYVLPWSLQLAKRLHEGAQRGEADGTRMLVDTNQATGERDVYLAPQPPNPPKFSRE